MSPEAQLRKARHAAYCKWFVQFEADGYKPSPTNIDKVAHPRGVAHFGRKGAMRSCA